jgi:uncharacterized protein YndB with AHSA1/START domain
MDNQISVTRDIAASPEAVWALVTDLERMGEWSPENQGGNWVTPATEAAVGAIFKGNNSHGKRRWTTKVKVLEFDSPHRFSFRLLAGRLGSCDWVYALEPSELGCLVTESWVDQRTPLLTWTGKIYTGIRDRGKHNRDSMLATLEAIATAVE